MSGSSGGGGGGSGAVEWPQYLEDTHTDWLDDSGDVDIVKDMTTVINVAQGNVVWANAVAYQGIGEINVIATYLLEFWNLVESFQAVTWKEDATEGAGVWADIYNGLGVDSGYFDPDPSAAIRIIGSWERPKWTRFNPIGYEKAVDDWIDPSPDASEDITDNLAGDTEISADVAAFGDVQDDRYNTDVLARFNAGARDIGAVMSSTFTVGHAIMEGMNSRDVAKYQGEVRTKAFLQRDNLLGQAYMQDDKIIAASQLEESRTVGVLMNDRDKILGAGFDAENKSWAASIDSKNKALSGAHIEADRIDARNSEVRNLIKIDLFKSALDTSLRGADAILRLNQIKNEYKKLVTQFMVDSARITYVINKEAEQMQTTYDINDEKWQLEVFQYGANLLAAVSGGTGYSGAPTVAQSVLGGAFAGAAVGTRLSPTPAGAVGGALLGGLGGYLMGQ